jgi:hypothetical protein
LGDSYIDRADEVLVTNHNVRQEDTKYDRKEPGAEEAFPCLLWGDLNERRAAKGDATDIRKDIVCDDHGHGQEEPNHALEDVIDDEMSLANN